MLLLILAFIILIVAGLYTAEVSRKATTIYVALVTLSFFLVAFMQWNLAVWFSTVGFIDAILLLHIFKGDITIRRH